LVTSGGLGWSAAVGWGGAVVSLTGGGGPGGVAAAAFRVGGTATGQQAEQQGQGEQKRSHSEFHTISPSGREFCVCAMQFALYKARQRMSIENEKKLLQRT
jgi:hypothetical protein